MDAVSSSTSIGQGNSAKNGDEFDIEDKHTHDEVDQDAKSNASKQKSSSSGAGKSKGKQASKPRRPHLQGRFSGRLETKTDEKKLVDECRLLGPLLGGIGKRGEKSRLTLAKIVRGIASGDIRRHCELREKQLNEMKQKVTDLENGQMDVQLLRKEHDTVQVELLEKRKECENLKQKLNGQAALANAATPAAAAAATSSLISAQPTVAAMPLGLAAGGGVSPLSSAMANGSANPVQVSNSLTTSNVAGGPLSQTVLQPSAVLTQTGATLQSVGVKPEQLAAVQTGPVGLQVAQQLVVPAAQQQGNFVGSQNIQILPAGTAVFSDGGQAAPVMSGPQSVAPQVQVSAQGAQINALTHANGSVTLMSQGQISSVGLTGLNQATQLVVSQAPQVGQAVDLQVPVQAAVQVVEQPQANAHNLQFQAETLGAQAQQQSLQAQAHAQLQAEASAQVHQLVAQANIHEKFQAQAAAQADHLKRVASAATSEGEDKQAARHVQDLECQAQKHAEAAFLSRAKAQELAATAQAHSQAHVNAQVQAQTLAVQAQNLQVAAHRFETSINIAQQQIAAQQHTAQLYVQQPCFLQSGDQQQQFNTLESVSISSFPTSSGSAAQLPRVVHPSAANLMEVANAAAAGTNGTGTMDSGNGMQVPTVAVVHSAAVNGTAPSQSNVSLTGMQLNPGATIMNQLGLEQPIQLVQAGSQAMLSSQGSMRQEQVVNVIQTQPVAIQQAVVDVKQQAPTMTAMSNGLQMSLQNMSQMQGGPGMMQHDNVMLYSNQQVVQQVPSEQMHSHMLQHTNSQSSQSHVQHMQPVMQSQQMGQEIVMTMSDNQMHAVVCSRAPDMLVMDSPMMQGQYDLSNLGLAHENDSMQASSMAASSIPMSGALTGLM